MRAGGKADKRGARGSAAPRAGRLCLALSKAALRGDNLGRETGVVWAWVGFFPSFPHGWGDCRDPPPHTPVTALSPQLSRPVKTGKSQNFSHEKTSFAVRNGAVGRGAAGRGKRLPPPKPIPEISAHSSWQRSFPSLTFSSFPFRVCGTNPLGIAAPKAQNVSPRIRTSCAYPVHPHPAHISCRVPLFHRDLLGAFSIPH